MREDEKRFYDDTQKLEEFLREATLNKSTGIVDCYEDKDYKVVLIKKGHSETAHKVHNVPEYLQKNGD